MAESKFENGEKKPAKKGLILRLLKMLFRFYPKMMPTVLVFIILLFSAMPP